MKILRAGGLLLISVGTLWAASIPFSYECSKDSGFIMDPNMHNRIGYITDFTTGSALQKDLQVSLPFKPAYPQFGTIQAANGNQNVAKVIGVIEKFTWNGGVGDSITIEFYVSQENATMLKALANSASTTSNVSSIGWWIGNYDQETKAWYEASKPLSSPTLKGVIQKTSSQPMLSVDMTPVPAKNGIDINVYKVSVSIAPVSHQVSTLSFANSSTKSVTKTWGLP